MDGTAGRAARASPTLDRRRGSAGGPPGWHGQAHHMGKDRAKKEEDHIGRKEGD